jgi:SM-20-related protein
VNATDTNRILVILDQFLTPVELDLTRTYAANAEARFSPATTVRMGKPGTLDVDRRRARVLTQVDSGEVGERFSGKIEQLLPEVLETLELPVRPARRITVQLTSTGDGGFYRPHTDNSPQDINRRVLSFVYFCNPYPESFQGGPLRIYGTRSQRELEAPGVEVHVVSPEQNRIVFFKSDFVHEICPVVCPTDKLWDTRLTVNGWVYLD